MQPPLPLAFRPAMEPRAADLAASRFLAAAAAVTILLMLGGRAWQGGLPAVAAALLLAELTLCGWRALALARAQRRRGLVLGGLALAAGAALGAWAGAWLWLAPPWAGAALALAVQAPLAAFSRS